MPNRLAIQFEKLGTGARDRPDNSFVRAGQLVLSTLAAYAFARFTFRGSGIAFALVLLQLMIMPDVLIVENYRAISALGLLDTIPAIGLPGSSTFSMLSSMRCGPAVAPIISPYAGTSCEAYVEP